MSIQDGEQVISSPDLELPEYVLNLLDARDAMVRARELAEALAASPDERFAEVRALFARTDLDEEAKILMIAQMSRADLPDELLGLIRARGILSGAQEMSRNIVGSQ